MPEGNNEWVKKAAVVAGCTALAAGGTYLVYKKYYAAPGAVTADSLKGDGNVFFQQKNYQKALEKFDEALVQAKENEKELRAICHQNAAACLEKLDRIPEAILRCSDAIALRPNYIKAIMRRANLHAILGENEECLRDFAYVSIIDPSSKLLDKSFNTFERVHKQAVEKEFHEIMLQRSQGIDFPIPETSVLEWLCYSVVKDPVVNAVNALKTVESQFDSILSLIKHKKFDLVAHAAIDELQKEDSNYKLECMYIAARFYTFHNNPKNVKEWIDKFFDYYNSLDDATKNSDHAKAYAISAYSILSETSDSLEQAQEFVDKAKELDPQNTDPRFGFAHLAILMKQLERAVDALEYVIAVDKDHPYARFYLNHFEFTKACEQQHMGNIHNHIVKMEKLVDEYPRAPIFTYTVLSNIHSNSGNFPLALEILDKGLKAYPDLSEFVMLKTLTAAKNNRSMEGNVEDMTQVFIDLCKRDPNNFEAQATYGKICSGKKEFDKAIESLERAIMLARQPGELQLALQELVLTKASREAHYLIETLNPSQFAH
ncbi:hypothetical protein FO519_003777 [Halicephalobus sp. NKZ332]|nr:hypothetical protein FO519_003777 [Halicephalobus sp. NKZ332]